MEAIHKVMRVEAPIKVLKKYYTFLVERQADALNIHHRKIWSCPM
jgi:hypothetical protein